MISFCSQCSGWLLEFALLIAIAAAVVWAVAFRIINLFQNLRFQKKITSNFRRLPATRYCGYGQSLFRYKRVYFFAELSIHSCDNRASWYMFQIEKATQHLGCAAFLRTCYREVSRRVDNHSLAYSLEKRKRRRVRNEFNRYSFFALAKRFPRR